MTTRPANLVTTTLLATVAALVLPGALSRNLAQATTPERAAYERYGCAGCHGESGKGSCDLRDANRTFPDDASLRAFIDRPSSVHPGSRMPAFVDVIEEADYPALIRHVRALSDARGE